VKLNPEQAVLTCLCYQLGITLIYRAGGGAGHFYVGETAPGVGSYCGNGSVAPLRTSFHFDGWGGEYDDIGDMTLS